MVEVALALSVRPDSSPTALIDWAKAAEDAGMAGVFVTEAGNDSIACAMALGLHTRRIPVGTAIANIYLRRPTLLGAEVAAAHEFTNGRFILGLGTGHRELNGSLGILMGDPISKMRETIASLRELRDAGRIEPRVRGAVPIYMAAISSPMVRLAAKIADGVIFNFFPSSRIREALGELADGVAAAGRQKNAVKPVLIANAFISEDLRAAHRLARKLLSRYGALRFYGDMLSRAGFRPEVEKIRAAGENAAGAMGAVSDAMIEATMLIGSQARIRERLAEIGSLGIAMVIVLVNPVREAQANAIMRSIALLRA